MGAMAESRGAGVRVASAVRVFGVMREASAPGVVGVMGDICAFAVSWRSAEIIKLTHNATIMDMEIWRMLIKTVITSNGLMVMLIRTNMLMHTNMITQTNVLMQSIMLIQTIVLNRTNVSPNWLPKLHFHYSM